MSPEMPTLVPVRTLEAPNAAALSSADPERTVEPQAPETSQASPSGMIEIELGDGRRIRVGNDVNVFALRRVLQALQT